MDNYEFNLLPITCKATYTWNDGAFLAFRIQGEHRINLYHVGKLFAEVVYNIGNNSIVNIKSFKSKCLEEYLDKIEIDY